MVGLYSRSKQTSKKVSNNSTDSVDGEYVERVVNSKRILKLGGEVASNGADNTEDDG